MRNVVLLLLAGAPRLAGAQAAAPAPTSAVTELSGGMAVALAHEVYAGPELALGRRSGQGRVALAVTGGWLASSPAMRVEARGQFLMLSPARSAPGVYAGVGSALVASRQHHGSAYVSVVLGIETAAWQSRGWYGEVGLGGGVRLAAGVRLRQFPAWWP